jgi:anti-sigma B factor antagonist
VRRQLRCASLEQPSCFYQIGSSVNSLFLQDHRDIRVNLKGVLQIDTTGLAAITAIRSASERHRGTIKLLNLPPRVHDLLVITKLITLFDVFESEADAVRSFAFF